MEKEELRNLQTSVPEVPAVNGEIFKAAEEEATHMNEEHEDTKANLAKEKDSDKDLSSQSCTGLQGSLSRDHLYHPHHPRSIILLYS